MASKLDKLGKKLKKVQKVFLTKNHFLDTIKCFGKKIFFIFFGSVGLDLELFNPTF